ncbi:MAG: YggS family pyridoxal phosphate-dependent enzyme [Victivallaceae bacterium]|nr:YggS family pyridoxal phosphate-dependent enzyme [Victivallaceae bacterium]
MADLIANYKAVRASAALCAIASGRAPEEVKVLAVSKTFPAADIQRLYDAQNVREFAESKAQELEEKAKTLPDDIVWHFIGHLQGNKVRKVVRIARVIHSVDSEELIERLDRIAGEERKHLKILLEVNLSGEENKSGAYPEEIIRLTATCVQSKNLELIGLMTMAPEDANEERLGVIFGTLSDLKTELNRLFELHLTELSMGMSGDYKVAIARGATIVRIGSRIFGERDYGEQADSAQSTRHPCDGDCHSCGTCGGIRE